MNLVIEPSGNHYHKRYIIAPDSSHSDSTLPQMELLQQWRQDQVHPKECNDPPLHHENLSRPGTPATHQEKPNYYCERNDCHSNNGTANSLKTLDHINNVGFAIQNWARACFLFLTILHFSWLQSWRRAQCRGIPTMLGKTCLWGAPQSFCEWRMFWSTSPSPSSKWSFSLFFFVHTFCPISVSWMMPDCCRHLRFCVQMLKVADQLHWGFLWSKKTCPHLTLRSLVSWSALLNLVLIATFNLY
jgi:hypothetical protein